MDSEKREHFPDTLATWIARNLGGGTPGNDAVRNHVMSIYREPLRAYLLGRRDRDRWLRRQDADDLIAGFFADRLARPKFFEDWLGSGKRLRFWLINALGFYLKELGRREERNERENAMPLPDDLVDPAEFVYEQAYAKSVVQAALRDAEESCLKGGLATHFEIFVRHFRDDISYAGIESEMGISEARAAVMARSGQRRFVAAVEGVLAREGVEGRDNLDREIAHLLEAMER